MSRFSSSNASSLRQSLGMPVRVSFVPDELRGASQNKMSKIPTIKSTTASGRVGLEAQRRKTVHGGTKRQTQAHGGARRQTQVLSGTSRPSTGRSSVYGSAHGSQIKKDPRPLTDKAFQQASIKKLILFLSERNYPTTFTPKSLQTPTCREFLHIFNFMMEILDDSLIIDSMNSAEEVPKVLKLLGYPFTISKNHMLNVGSPHSWPILLGALVWLIDCCSLPDSTSQILFSQEEGFGDEDERMAIEFRVEEIMYETYMASEEGEASPKYQELVQGRADCAKEEIKRYQDGCDSYSENNAQLRAIIEELSKSSIPTLQSQVQQNEQTYTELTEYLNSQMVPAINQTRSACSEADAAASEIEMQIEASQNRISELEEQIRHQPMSAKDAQDLHQNIEDSEDMLNKNRTMQQESRQRVSELQMQHNRSVSLIDNECRQVNDKLRRLAAVLPDVASLSPLDYDCTSKRADVDVLHTLVECAKKLKQDVATLYERVAATSSELESRTISIDDAQSSLHSEQVRKQFEIDNLQHTLDIEKGALDQKKKRLEDGMKVQQMEKHALEKRLMDLQEDVQREPAAEKELAAFEKHAESEQAWMAKDLYEKDRQLKQFIMALTKFIESLQHHQKGVRKEVEMLVGKFQRLKLPSVDPLYLSSTS